MAQPGFSKAAQFHMAAKQSCQRKGQCSKTQAKQCLFSSTAIASSWITAAEFLFLNKFIQKQAADKKFTPNC